MARFAIIGSGAWGLAMAMHLHKQGHDVAILVPRTDTWQRLEATREHPEVLPGVRLSATIAVYSMADTLELRHYEHWLFAVPTRYLRSVLPAIADQWVRPATGIVSLTKGIENDTFARPSEIITNYFPGGSRAVVSGPSHAEEVAAGKPTSVLVASETDYAETLQPLISSDKLRVYVNDDPLGVELAGAIKNVLGIAAGVGDGLGFGDNAKAALLSRGIVEMTRFGVACGAKAETFAGLAGLGDLMATCFSLHGRNRRAGERLARGTRVNDIISGPQVVEGYFTAKSIFDRCQQLNLDMPICRGVYEMLYEGKPPAQAVKDLMARKPTREAW